jgi:hypothetical protein
VAAGGEANNVRQIVEGSTLHAGQYCSESGEEEAKLSYSLKQFNVPVA